MDEAKLLKLRKAFGLRVRALRQAQGLSQEAFAYECDLHRTYMGGIERGERNVSFDNIAIIANTLGITIGELVTGIK